MNKRRPTSRFNLHIDEIKAKLSKAQVLSRAQRIVHELTSDSAKLVLGYTPWWVRSAELMPQFAYAANRLKELGNNKVLLGMIDAEYYPKVAFDLGIKESPMLLLFLYGTSHTGDSQLEGRDHVRYSRDHLLQLKENRLDIDNIVKDVDKFRAADRWMGKIYRNHRSKTRRKWIKIGDAARLKGSNDEDWKKVIEHWVKEMEEERQIMQSEEPPANRTKSMIGKDARSRVKYPHRAGSRSFESRRNEQINQNRQLPNAIEFFKLTRYCDLRPDGIGGWVSQRAADDYEKMYEESQASNKPETPEEIVDQFMNADKRFDYHLGRGYGPPSVGRSSRKQVRMQELEAALEETRANLQEERTLWEQQSEQIFIDGTSRGSKRSSRSTSKDMQVDQFVLQLHKIVMIAMIDEVKMIVEELHMGFRIVSQIASKQV